MATIEELQAQNEELRSELTTCHATIANRDATVHDLRQANARKDAQITRLITAHHHERMVLLNGVETRLDQLLQLHQQLERQLRQSENRVTTAPAEDDRVHGFAMTLRPLRQEGAHEIRFIAGQESYVTRQVSEANALLFEFTETGNPIDLRQNFQRVANERLRARITTYLAETPSRKRKLPISFSAAADRAGSKTTLSRSKKLRKW
ncbi:hypothetical protein PF008_g27494 [Phytophthora fragariae]|uniref:Uncharacterized protein n=1 Tax=Phytophthora fragariae TaxID=53985 RepID=A0A6G0QEW1_9STRA|nr:hypothetical protein PF008_g27494 [Phytophthora fragariae]